MKTISVADLSQNPTAALEDVEAGESYVVTRHGRPIARLVALVAEPMVIIPPKRSAPTTLTTRPQRHTYEGTDALLKEMASDR